MATSRLERIQFREGQYLTADDLNQEQLYRIAEWRRHRSSSHTWGIVQGLTLKVPDQNLKIHSGVAVDGFGRELIVPQNLLVEEGTLDDVRGNAKAIDVWLLYARVPEVANQGGRWECSPGQDNRWREETRVRLIATSEEIKINPLEPHDVLESDLSSTPYGDLPDEDTWEWPVYLGRIRHDNSYKPEEKINLVYAGLVGEQIVSASGLTCVHLARGQGTRRQFVVATRQDVSQPFEDQFMIASNGEAEIYGDLVVEADKQGAISNLILEQSQQSGGLEWTPLAKTPEQALPWHLYHTDVKAKTDDKPPESQQTLAKELRFELFNPGDKGDSSQYRFAIGGKAKDKKDKDEFETFISVDANCTVYIKTLKVAGKIIEGPIPPDLGDERFRGALQAVWHEGVVAGSTALVKLQATFVDMPKSIQPDKDLEYKIKITNPKDITVPKDIVIRDIQLHATVSIPDSPTVEFRETIGSLGQGQSKTIRKQHSPKPKWPVGELSIAVIVWGFISDYVAINAYAQATVNVLDGIE